MSKVAAIPLEKSKKVPLENLDIAGEPKYTLKKKGSEPQMKNLALILMVALISFIVGWFSSLDTTIKQIRAYSEEDNIIIDVYGQEYVYEDMK